MRGCCDKRLFMHRLIHWARTIRANRASYYHAHGRWPGLLRPRRFSEKMQWRKLFDRNPLFAVFCDKLATRARIARLVGEDYLAPLAWVGGAGEIPFDRLAPPYFLKSSHASGQVMCVTPASAEEPALISQRAAEWLEVCYFAASGEPGYRDVPRRLMVEQALLGEDGQAPLERRLFVFGGKVAVINTVFVEAGNLRNGAFHTPDWQRVDWYFTRFLAQDFPKPRRLGEMIRIAEILGAGIDHVRVDFFDCGERIYVGELTPYSWSGLSRFNTDAADLALGGYWRVRWPLWRAVTAVLLGGR